MRRIGSRCLTTFAASAKGLAPLAGTVCLTALPPIHQQWCFSRSTLGGSAKGTSRRLSFSERSEKRAGKTRAEKEEIWDKRDQAIQYAQQDVPKELELMADKSKRKAQDVLDALTNLGRVLERMEINVQGKGMPMAQVANILRVSGIQYRIVPHKPAFVGPLSTALMKLNDVKVQREGTNVRLDVPQMSRERREKAVLEIQSNVSVSNSQFNLMRTTAVNSLDEYNCGEDLKKELSETIDDAVRSQLASLKDELVDIEEQILLTDIEEEEEEGTPTSSTE